MTSPKGDAPVSVEEALRLLDRHWSARLLPYIDLPGHLLAWLGLHAAAESYARLVDPAWNWLCDEQARFFDRIRGYDEERDDFDPAMVFAAGAGLAMLAACSRIGGSFL